MNKKLNSPETTITLTKEEVQQISHSGSAMYFLIEFFRDTYKVESGKVFRFRTHTLFFKSNLIIY